MIDKEGENNKSPEGSEKEGSSQGTNYVEATQLYLQSPIEVNADVNCSATKDIAAEKVNLLKLEKLNYAFLAKFWANIAENEEAEQRLLR